LKILLVDKLIIKGTGVNHKFNKIKNSLEHHGDDDDDDNS